MNTPIFEENAIDDFKGIDIMRAVRSFDPCLPCGVHMYLGKGKVLRKEHSPDRPAQHRRLSANAKEALAAPIDLRVVGDRIEELLDAARVVARRPRAGTRCRTSSASSPSSTAAGSPGSSSWPARTRRSASAGRRRPRRLAAGPPRPPPARSRGPRAPARSTRCGRTSGPTAGDVEVLGDRRATPASSRLRMLGQLRRVRVVVGHPRARGAGGHRGSGAGDRPHRRRRRRPTAGRGRLRSVDPGDARPQAEPTPRPMAPDLRPAGPRARAGRAARDRGQQAHRVPRRHAALRLPQRAARSARARSTPPPSTVRCCAARCATPPTTCRAPAAASTATPRTSTRSRSSRTAARFASRSTASAMSSDPLDVLQRIRQRTGPAPPGRALRHVRRARRPTSTSTSSTPDSRNLMCTCRGCWLLFTSNGAGGGQVPRRARPLRVARRCQIAPGAVGRAADPRERRVLLLQLDDRLRRRVLPEPGRRHRVAPAARRLGASSLADNEVLRTMEADVEALIVRRDGDHDDAFLVPIDACYELVGELRRLWKGFDGGTEARDAMDAVLRAAAERGRHDRPERLRRRRASPTRTRPSRRCCCGCASRRRRPSPSTRWCSRPRSASSPSAAATRPRRRARLVELFGESAAVGRVAAAVPVDPRHRPRSPSSPGTTEIDLPVPCTYDFEVAAAKYLHSLGDGEIPLVLLFNGTDLQLPRRRARGASRSRGTSRPSIGCRSSVWRATMDVFFPNSGWIRLRRETIDALTRVQGRPRASPRGRTPSSGS